MPQKPLLPVADALVRVLDGAGRLGIQSVPLVEAHGRVLAEPLVARRTQPSFRSSAMDGYAICAADAVEGARLALIGESAAGHLFSGTLGPGQAVRIFTGGAVPDGADAILIQEDAEADGDLIVVKGGVKPGQFVRPAGLDFQAGDILAPAGTLLSPRVVGLAAATGASHLEVAKRPRVAILATGDELVPPGAEPGSGQINVSNSLTLAGLVRAEGGEVLDLGIAVDTLDAIRSAARSARDQGADILITTGGASVGDRDLVREALGAEGLKLDFWRIAMRPGRPMMFGALGETRMLGLPGNPVSSHVCAILFLVPLLRALQGRLDVHHRLEAARLGSAVGPNDWREDYVRARLELGADGQPIATPFPRQDSSMLKVLADADCLIVRPIDDPARAAGDDCRIIRLGPNS